MDALKTFIWEIPVKLDSLRKKLLNAFRLTVECQSVVLIVVCHCDDEAIGPGGTILSLGNFPKTAVFLVVLAADNAVRVKETMRALRQFFKIPPNQTFLFQFPDGHLKEFEDDIAMVLREFSDILLPDLVITHKIDEANEEHDLIAKLCRRIFWRHGVTVIHFRIPQPMPAPWHPVVFFRISQKIAQQKVDELFSVYKTENWKDYFRKLKTLGIIEDAGDMAGNGWAEPYEVTSVYFEPSPCGLAVARNPVRGRATNFLDSSKRDSYQLASAWHISKIVLEPCPCGCGRVIIGRNIKREAKAAA